MKKQASSKHCFVCGIENKSGLNIKFYEMESGEIHAQVIVPDRLQSYPGIVHGGIVAAMLDEVSGRAFMNGNPNRFMFTARLNIRYRKPAPTGKVLNLVGRIKADHGRVGTALGEIYNEQGELLAEAVNTLAEITQETLLSFGASDNEWMVYSDQEAHDN